MHRSTIDHRLPKIIVSDADHERLSGLASAVLHRMPDVAEYLLAEMDRAEIASAGSIPANAVQMGSTVTFRSDDGQVRCVTLVFPNEADIAEGKISILTPIGTALIGLSQGQSIMWTTREGRQRELTVLSVGSEAVQPAVNDRIAAIGQLER